MNCMLFALHNCRICNACYLQSGIRAKNRGNETLLGGWEQSKQNFWFVGNMGCYKVVSKPQVQY
jgi:hypothetical protein